MTRPLTRLLPALPVGRMQTYRVMAPRTTHTRPATCEEVGCPQWKKGWVTRVPIGSDEEAFIRQIIGRHSPDGLRRDAHEMTGLDSTVAEFVFNPGSPCFRASTHRKKLDRPEIYLVRGGDWRANTGLIRRHTKPEYWIEDSQESFDRMRKFING